MQLSTREIQRYSRQIILRSIGAEGQFKLKNARILVTGLGGLGAPASMYLAGAGIGMLDLMDHDKVHRSNLHRQPLYSESDIGSLKAECAASRINGLNPDITVGIIAKKADFNSLDLLIPNYDVVLDCTDNIRTKFLINDKSIEHGIILCHAGALGFDAQVLSVKPGSSPCLRCVFGNTPDDGSLPDCSESGVLGAVVGLVGALIATEAVKIILGQGEPLFGRLLHIDALSMKFREINVKTSEGCNCKKKLNPIQTH